MKKVKAVKPEKTLGLVTSADLAIQFDLTVKTMRLVLKEMEASGLAVYQLGARKKYKLKDVEAFAIDKKNKK